ncbi:hypothetical protein M409DRAFT_49716 [Zasmidium cellare ATCC 36951]|uniref:Uncharacterized protein n=1 Tax=Zasmidium cellare ATCC 36951 TaxID=1080233 RepID=A0A6A6D2C8_ZASCE|nr:uncharacterized protein M409DRAFT_49716 [Zasmidium cellare ATCC 36951]KAF2173243.1 hypothetical protein M409DRAFT_49716 [Zasmidium cellare ATCC 36951]
MKDSKGKAISYAPLPVYAERKCAHEMGKDMVGSYYTFPMTISEDVVPKLAEMTILWQKRKNAFTVDRNAVTIGADDLLHLVAWERASPETPSYETKTTKNRESFAWASFALNIMRKYQMDCSSGHCEPVFPGADDSQAEGWRSTREDPNVYPSSCLRQLDPNNPVSTIFDPDAGERDTRHALNKIWLHINQLNTGVIGQISDEAYEGNVDTRKLMAAFWAIYSRPQPADTFRPQGVYKAKLKEVRTRYDDLRKAIAKVEPDSKKKPKLFCDTTYQVMQQANFPARDHRGREIRDRMTDQVITLREWETQHGRNFDNNWYFWFEFARERGYMVFQKSTWPPLDANRNYPWPLDPRTNQPSICQIRGVDGFTWTYDELPEDDDHGTDAWIYKPHIALCPRSFQQSQYRSYDIKTAPQPEGTHLDTMGIVALTFYHELFHFTEPVDSVDVPTKFAKRNADGSRDPRWPAEKAGYRHFDEHRTWGALQRMSLAMFERARDETMDWKQSLPIRNPESYAWFALTLAIQLVVGQDWSSGAARPAGSPHIPVTATIPGDRPPAHFIDKPTGVPIPDVSFEELFWSGVDQGENITTLENHLDPTTYDEEMTTTPRECLDAFHSSGMFSNTTFITSTRSPLKQP